MDLVGVLSLGVWKRLSAGASDHSSMRKREAPREPSTSQLFHKLQRELGLSGAYTQDLFARVLMLPQQPSAKLHILGVLAAATKPSLYIELQAYAHVNLAVRKPATTDHRAQEKFMCSVHKAWL